MSIIYHCPFSFLQNNGLIVSEEKNMSSGGVTVADGGPQIYFCHQCDRTVTISPLPGGDLLCPTCNSGFVEEFQNPNPNPTISDPFLPDPFSFFLSQFLLPSSSPNHRPAPILPPQTRTDDFDPVSYLLNRLAQRRASGVDYQFIINDGDGPSASGFPLPANIGDYFMGPGFEQLIEQLAENDPNRYGTPPAAKYAIEALPSIKVDQDLMKSELAQCAVCKDDFQIGTMVKQMPCKHVYHEECIMPWLDLHNSCPVCRYELPTDDPDYENGSSLGGNSVSRGINSNNIDNNYIANDSAGDSGGQWTMERFNILGGFGSGSGSGSSDGDLEHQNQESN